MNFIRNRSLLLLLSITLFSTLSIWFAFYFHLPQRFGFPSSDLETVFANYDGPNYLVISKCGYVKDCVAPLFSLPQPLEYYPAHLPGYPLLISYFSYYTTAPKAMLFSTLLGSLFLTAISYQFFGLFLNQRSAFWLTFLSIFFPARLFVLRLVGAPETWFLATILTSVYFFKKDKFFVSALFAALAQLFKSPGILLFASYGIIFLYKYFTTKKIDFRFAWYLLTPLTVLVIFAIYQYQTGDFFAYFNSGDNFHLNPLPYLVFISNQSWINTIWLEDVIYIYLLSFIGLSKLIKKYRFDIIFLFPAVFILATVFVAHRDISRYIAPVYPFLLLAYNQVLNRRVIKLAFILLIPAIILFAINFISGNTAPIADWSPYL